MMATMSCLAKKIEIRGEKRSVYYCKWRFPKVCGMKIQLLVIKLTIFSLVNIFFREVTQGDHFRCRRACGFQNLVWTAVLGGHNLSPLVEIGLRWLPKLGVDMSTRPQARLRWLYQFEQCLVGSFGYLPPSVKCQIPLIIFFSDLFVFGEKV